MMMLSRSLSAISANLIRPNGLIAARSVGRAGQRMGISTSQTLANKQDKPDDNKRLWVEDNLYLDIKESENETIVEAIPTKTGREQRLIPAEPSHSEACALCRLNLRNLDYTDVLILAQFIKKNGSIVTYHESKLCGKQYRKVVRLIARAQRCNLIKRPADYLVPGPWHDLNTYIEPDRRRDQPMKVIKKEYWRV